MGKWKSVQPGEKMFWNCNHPIRLVCCDCGLVHIFKIAKGMRRGFILVQAWRDNRATAARRRHRSKRFRRAITEEP